MIKFFPILFLFTLSIGVAAQPKLSEVILAEDVESGIPVNPAVEFPHRLGAVFLMTRVEGYLGGAESRLIYHNWMFKREGAFISVAKVPLEIRSESWRTWSRKRVTSRGIGEWKVEILDEDGNLLRSIPFHVTK